MFTFSYEFCGTKLYIFFDMTKFFLIIGALSGFLAVAIGAFGAHSLRAILTAHQRTDTFELAVKYQFYHSLALLLVGILLHLSKNAAFATAGYCFLGGICIFSGSLYALALTNVGKLGAITPIGGVLFLVGWAILCWQAYQSKNL